MKWFLEIVRSVLRFVGCFAIMPIFAPIQARKLINEARNNHSSFFGELREQAFRRERASIIFFGCFWVAVWTVVVYFAWPYAFKAVLWLWPLETTRAGIFMGAGLILAWLFHKLKGHLRYVEELERKVAELQSEQVGAGEKYNSLSKAHQDTVAGLEAIRRRSLASRDRMQSRVVEVLRLEVEEVLQTYSFNRFNANAEATCQKWENSFKVKEEMIVRGRQGLSAAP